MALSRPAPPFTILDDKNTLMGVSADILAAFSAATNNKITIHQFSSPLEILDELQSKNIDIININTFFQHERHISLEKHGKFTDYILPNENAILVSTKDEPYKDYTHGTKSKIAYSSRTTDSESLNKEFPSALTISYDDYHQAYDDLCYGEIDYLLGSRMTTSYLNDQCHNTFYAINQTNIELKKVRFLIRKDLNYLHSITNKFINYIQRKNIISRSLHTWLQDNPDEQSDYISSVSHETQQWLRSKPTIRIGLVSNDTPFSYINSDGNWKGLVVDILGAVDLSHWQPNN